LFRFFENNYTIFASGWKKHRSATSGWYQPEIPGGIAVGTRRWAVFLRQHGIVVLISNRHQQTLMVYNDITETLLK